MTEILSPKMQTLINDMTAGTKVVVEHDGHFQTYEVREDGETWMGRAANPTIKGLISRGILVKGEGNRWVLATTAEVAVVESAPEVTEVEVEVEVAEIITETPDAWTAPVRTSATLMTVGMKVKRLNGTEVFEVTGLTRTRKGPGRVHILARPVGGGPERHISKHAGDTWKDLYWNVSDLVSA